MRCDTDAHQWHSLTCIYMLYKPFWEKTGKAFNIHIIGYIIHNEAGHLPGES